MSERHAYGPYGEEAGLTGSALRFAGRRLDAETGLYHNRARTYAPALGRFLQPDPIGYQGGLNLYAYVGNDPLNLTDPMGTKAEPGLFDSAVNGLWNLLDPSTINPNKWAANGAIFGGTVGGGVGGLLGGGAGGAVGTLAAPGAGTVIGAGYGAAEGAVIGIGAGAAVGSAAGYYAAQSILYMTGNDGAGKTNAQTDDAIKYPNNPKSARQDFVPIKGSPGRRNINDGSIWERDTSSHGGEQWKRWPDQKSWENGDTPNSVWQDGRVRK